MEKSYYQQLKPIVLPYVKHYLTDFTTHDKRKLRQYRGEFYYAIRKTGTDIFLYNKCAEAFFALARKEETSYFTSKGLRSVYEGTVDIGVDHFLLYCLLERYQNDRFFIGKHMEIREVEKVEFDRHLKEKVKVINELAAQLKGSPFVYELYQKELKKDQENRQKQMAA